MAMKGQTAHRSVLIAASQRGLRLRDPSPASSLPKAFSGRIGRNTRRTSRDSPAGLSYTITNARITTSGRGADFACQRKTPITACLEQRVPGEDCPEVAGENNTSHEAFRP